MRAVVLTFDGNQHIAEHMIRRFDSLWPDNPFRFTVPFQSKKAIDRPAGIEFVVSPKPIVATVLTLLEGISDQEWIFWCMDDHFPVRLDEKWLAALISCIGTGVFDEFSGVNFCASYRAKRLWRNALVRRGECRRIGDDNYVVLPDYDQIWLPQFIRAGALRRFFIQMPEPVSGAKEMDESKRALVKPPQDILLMAGSDRAIFAESTYAGIYTRDFLASARRMGIGVDEIRLSRGAVTKNMRGKMGLADRIERLIK